MISRRNFVKVASLLGVGALGGLTACGEGDEGTTASGETTSSEITSSGITSAIIVGAGPAGMSAAHLLRQRGVDFTILEAKDTHGGRIKTAHDFVDFPIPLGGEWIHVDPEILDTIINDPSIERATKLSFYDDQDSGAAWDGTTLTTGEAGENADVKFVGDTWLTFFEQYVLPGIESDLRLNAPVEAIDYSGDEVTVTIANGETVTADAVIVTVPVMQLRKRAIEFTPALPDDKLAAIDDVQLWTGMKVFLEFSEQWYPTFLEIAGSNSEAGQKLFYDAAYGQDSDAHVLGLFTVGDQSWPYQERTGEDLVGYILAELDEMYDGAASRTFVQHVAQNWEAEPYIEQAYIADEADWRLPPKMQRPVQSRVFFAGDAYTDGEDWSSVHMAAISASEAVDRLLS